jgi:hypothetical protein
MIAMMDMMRMTTEPKNVYPLAELSILKLVFALTIPSPSILEGLTGMWQLLPGLEHTVGLQPEAVCDECFFLGGTNKYPNICVALKSNKYWDNYKLHISGPWVCLGPFLKSYLQKEL